MSIEIKNISKSYGIKKAVEGLSVTLPDNGFIAVTGKSGSGKTTLLKMIAGLEKPDAGDIIFSPAEQRISMVFQEDRLLEKETALSNAKIASDEETAAAMLSILGLSDVMDKKAAELSGGMARRVAIARALSAPADVFIFDEPIKGLDKETAEQTLDVIKRKTEGSLVIFVSHSGEEIQGADMVITLDKKVTEYQKTY